ncbi:Chymotrypsin inhibitor [Anthophora retusa]
MSTLYILRLLTKFKLTPVIDAQKICPENEEYKECGTACEPLCGHPDPIACIAVCVERCQCLSGYRRNSKGNCVLSKDC